MTDQSQRGDDPISVANRWIEAYNAKDLDTIRSLCGESIRLEHHNRGVVLEGPDAVVGLIEQFTSLGPDRAFHSTRRQFTDGDQVVTEQSWGFTAATDVPGFAAAGERFDTDLACIWTVRNGQIVDYHDYG
jgi:ketosteroid isomerase-like protein